MAVQAATAKVMAMREVDAGPTAGTNMANSVEACWHRHGGLTLRKPSFNWNTPDKYIALSGFEREVTNILHTKTYELNEEEKVPIIKNSLRRKQL